jgi:formate dehydrogenase subunit gamma
MNKSDPQHSIQALIASHASMKGALLPLLHAIQDQFGFIPPESVGEIAKGLNLSRAEVHGVITYYHFFRTSAPGKHVVQVCRAEACQACGADALFALAEKTLAATSITLEPVYCLGLCASSPAIQVDDKLHACVSADKLKKILTQLEAA